jgi:molybdopterin/thiamine biosynthesis adenylyltransferase
MPFKIKDSIAVTETAPSTYTVIFTCSQKLMRLQVDALSQRLFVELQAPRTQEELLERLKDYFSQEDILSCFQSLQEHGIIAEYRPEVVPNRHRRQFAFIQEYIPAFQEALQAHTALTDATVVVFGVGGIGSWIVNGLHQLGIGEIRICDPDVVEETNLNRQLFYSSTDIGEAKVDVLARKLADAKIITYKRFVAPQTMLDDIVLGSDLLINCADSPSTDATTAVLDSLSRKFNIPYLSSGGYNMHLGMVGSLVVPGKSACFDCFVAYQKEHEDIEKQHIIKPLVQPGNLGPIAGVVANLHVMEVFKYFTGIGEVNYNKFAEIDCMDLSVSWRTYTPRVDCERCSSIASKT